MRTPQCRQRPRSRPYETSGTLSYQRISCAHDMHADGGRTIDRRSGTRAATTFRKLPRASAGANTTAASAKSTLARAVRGLLRVAGAVRVPRRAEGQVGEARQRLHLDALTERQRVRDDRALRLGRLSERDVPFREDRALEERA